MACPTCHIAMYVNGRFWQCAACGYLIPYGGGYVPAYWRTAWA
jgi:ribosomal protein L37AE/L43A